MSRDEEDDRMSERVWAVAFVDCERLYAKFQATTWTGVNAYLVKHCCLIWGHA